MRVIAAGVGTGASASAAGGAGAGGAPTLRVHGTSKGSDASCGQNGLDLGMSKAKWAAHGWDERVRSEGRDLADKEGSMG